MTAPKHWLQTVSGGQWDAEHPERYRYTVRELATALSHVARYAGHTAAPYSVARHSVWVSDCLTVHYPGEHALHLAGLLHDAAEAYTGDVPSPIKRMPHMSGYRTWATKVEDAISSHFRLPLRGENSIHDPRVKAADMAALATEKRDILGPSPHDGEWLESLTGAPGFYPSPERITPLSDPLSDMCAFATRANMLLFWLPELWYGDDDHG